MTDTVFCFEACYLHQIDCAIDHPGHHPWTRGVPSKGFAFDAATLRVRWVDWTDRRCPRNLRRTAFANAQAAALP